MARRLVQYTLISDDFERDTNPDLKAEETVEIAIDGMVYEVDCSAAKAAELRQFLANWQEVAHDRWKMPARPGKRKALRAQAITQVPKPETYGGQVTLMRDRDARRAIREWCNENGHPCAKTGKLPVEGLREYMETNPDAYVPESTLIDAGLKEMLDAV